MEFETVKEALEYLLTLNNLKTRSIVDGHLATVDDYKESNLEALYSLCDLLGLTDSIQGGAKKMELQVITPEEIQVIIADELEKAVKDINTKGTTKQWMNKTELANYLGIGRPGLNKLIEKGMPKVMFEKTYKFYVPDVNKWLTNRK